MGKLFRRIHFLLNRRRLERELADEMAAHRDMLPEHFRAAFGNVTRLREDARDAWAWIWLDRLWQDLTYAVRMSRRSPGFTLGAVTVLALGVGANLAEFHIFDAILLHRINVPGADSIYRFIRNTKDQSRGGFPPGAVDYYRQHCTLCAFVISENTSVVTTVESNREQSNFVSGNYFASLKLVPAWGRLLVEADSLPGAPAVALLSYEYFSNRWGADPHIINRILYINSKPVQIVGVVPDSFGGLAAGRIAVWLPSGANSTSANFSSADQDLFARPRSGVSPAALDAQLTTLTRQLANREPKYFRSDERILGDRLLGSGLPRRFLLNPAVMLMIFMALLVLISACANLANMLVARGLARRREIDIRIALGAGRRRIFRQLLTENLLLAILGACAGLLFGYTAARWLMRELNAPSYVQIGVDWQILAGGAALAFISVLTFGLAPALQLARGNHRPGLRRQIHVGVQVAVSCLLLICSAVLTRGAIQSATVELTFDYQNMITAFPELYALHLGPAVARQKLDELIGQLQRLPGVESVTAAVNPPLSQRFRLDTLPGLPPIGMNHVAPSYFAALHLPVLRGRSFTAADTNAVIVSEAAARAAWPNQDPIGRTWKIESADRTVVGVVKDSGANLMIDSESVEAYLPIDSAHIDEAALIVRAKGEPSALAQLIPRVLTSGGRPVNVILMREGRDKVLDTQRKMISIIGSLGAIATTLAAAGMFGLMAFAVAQRTRELGIRMAIGAGPGHILSALLGQNVAPVLIGALAGILMGFVTGRLARSLIQSLSTDPLRPIDIALGIVAFVLIAVLATLSPALKALRIDPSATLRCE